MISLVLVLSFTIGFFVRLYTLYFNPTYLFSPHTYSYEKTTAKLNLSAGNTFAVAVVGQDLTQDQTSELVRVQFEVWNDKKEKRKSLNAVYCKDLYAAQIHDEMTGDS